jgi:aminoglycoside 3-N-acetyltransferase
MTLVVHSSLSSIGWVAGGAATVISTLLDAIGDSATLVMPAATPQCFDPGSRTDPQAREASVFDCRTTPTTMGAIAETFRTWPGTMRSDHPLESVCARGRAAAEITREHPLAFSEGPGGPWDKLYRLDSRILLVGVGFNRCTALHFAESLSSRRRVMTTRFARLEDGHRVAIEVPNVADDNDTHFPIIGDQYVSMDRATVDEIGQARSVLVAMRDLVDFARRYFDEALR